MENDMRAQAWPQPAQLLSRCQPTRIHRERSAGLELIVVPSTPVSELHLTVTPRRGELPAALVDRLAQVLQAWEATMVRLIAFGALTASTSVSGALRKAFAGRPIPLTWVEGASCTNQPIAGIQVHAIIGADIKTDLAEHGAVTCVWEDAMATHCVINGLGPIRTTGSRHEQSTETFEHLQSGLARFGMGMKDVARTWYFLDEILSWYGDFNVARSDFFARCELRAGSVPASTGVSGRNPASAALTAAAWAIRPHDGATKLVQVVPSPLQCPAPAYGSAFSRAVEIQSAGFRQLLVSGTASIAPEGHTEHVGDVRGQIELSMRVVAAILESRQMTFADISRATAYFKSPADVAAWEDWCARHEQRALPVVCASCAICRDDLLFEIELDAIQAELVG